MSHSPPEQSLADPLSKILDGIREFDEAVTARIESRAWISEHLNEIHDLSIRLMSLRFELSNMKRENW